MGRTVSKQLSGLGIFKVHIVLIDVDFIDLFLSMTSCKLFAVSLCKCEILNLFIAKCCLVP